MTALIGADVLNFAALADKLKNRRHNTR